MQCPRKCHEDWTTEFIQLHRIWPEVRPDDGGLYNQPAGYVLSMRVLDYATSLLRQLLEKVTDGSR